MELSQHRAGGVTGLHMAWMHAGAHQLPGPGEALCERLVPVQKLRQLSLEVIHTGFQHRHARVRSCHLFLHHATNKIMPWGAIHDGMLIHIQDSAEILSGDSGSS